jgi:hypothetical protein
MGKDEVKLIENYDLDLDKKLTEKKTVLSSETFIPNINGRWRGHPVGRNGALEFFDFVGDLINYEAGWLLVGECRSELNGRSWYRTNWSIEYDEISDVLTWDLSVGNRTQRFNNAFNNPDINIRIDSSGNPTAIILRRTINRFLYNRSYITF